MKKTIRVLALVLCCALAAATVAYAAGTYTTKNLTAYYWGIKLNINGSAVVPKDANGKVVDPFIVDGTTYLPVRAVSQALGKAVSWNDDTKTVTITDPAPGCAGSWKAVRISLNGDDLPKSTFAGGSFAMELKAGGAGVWTIGGVSYAVKWAEDNGALTITDGEGGLTYGTVTGNTMVLNVEGTLVTLTK